MPSSRDCPLRRDAAANRERLVAAAGELFAERGLGVTLNDIAHHAGVGVGTAYRRFANKDEIIDALFEQRLRDVVAVAQESLGDPDAWHGLVTFFESSLQMQLDDRGLGQIMHDPSLGNTRVADARDRIAPLIEEIVGRAKEQHLVRADLDQTDVVFAQLALSAIADATRGVADSRACSRHLAVFLDGIRAPQAPLPR